MSPATVPGLKYTVVDLVIALSIIGGLGVFMIVLSWYLGQQRSPVRPASARTQHGREEDSYWKTEIFLQDLPSAETVPSNDKKSY
jgi:hypothetical protein